jgi:methionine-rich copper-binding protein CopC
MSRRRTAPGAPLRWALSVLALATTASIALLGAGVPAASAHDALLAVSPADGSTTVTAPERVELEFSGVVQELGAEVVISGPDGAPAAQGQAQVVDSTLTQPLAPDLPAGTYSVAWRVTSADGHPIAGTTTFTVTGGAAAPGAVEEASAARPAGSSSSGPWIAVGAGAVLLVAIAVGARQLRRRG